MRYYINYNYRYYICILFFSFNVLAVIIIHLTYREILPAVLLFGQDRSYGTPGLGSAVGSASVS